MDTEILLKRIIYNDIIIIIGYNNYSIQPSSLSFGYNIPSYTFVF